MYERIQKAVKRAFFQAKISDDFLPIFEDLIKQHIQDLKIRKRVNEDKLKQEIKAVANRTKRENESATFFLQKISELLVYIIHGKHNDFYLDPDQTQLFNFSPLDLKDDPRNKNSF